MHTDAAQFHCLDENLQLFLHCPPECFNPIFVRGQTPQYLVRVVEAVHDCMPNQLDGVFFLISDPTAHARFGAPRMAPGRMNVLLFYGDETCGDYAFSSFHLVFRQYLYKSFRGQYAMPLPGVQSHKATGPELDFSVRPISVFFSGNMNANRVALYMALHRLPWPTGSFLLDRLAARVLRSRMPEQLHAKFPQAYLAFTEGFGLGLPALVYLEKLEQSKITICPGGFVAPETIRHYEAACAGSVVVSMPILSTGNHLLASAPFYFLESWAGLAQALRSLRDEPELVADLQARGYAWWNEHCSVKGFAGFIALKLRDPLVDCND